MLGVAKLPISNYSTKGQCEHENGMIEKIYNDLKVEFVYYAPRQVAIDKKKCLKYLGPFKNSLILGFDKENWRALHISTLFRQLTFEILYVIEYLVLLGFGLNSNVKV